MDTSRRKQLFDDNINLVYKYYHKHKDDYEESEWEDLLQDLLFKFWKILETYNDEKGNLSTYVYKIFDRMLIGKSIRQQKFDNNIYVIAYDARVPSKSDEDMILLNVLEDAGAVINKSIEKDSKCNDMFLFNYLYNNTKFSEKEKRIIDYTLQGLTNKEISQIMNITGSNVSSCKSKIVDKMKRTYEFNKTMIGYED